MSRVLDQGKPEQGRTPEENRMTSGFKLENTINENSAAISEGIK
jgi:hypothetical protein